MPIYEYTCRKCDHEFEVMKLSRSEFKDIKCPECNSVTVDKMFSTFSSNSSESSSVPSCAAEGTCDMPSAPCATGGMCGFN